MESVNRRQFATMIAAATAGALAAGAQEKSIKSGTRKLLSQKPRIAQGLTVLFQGDSITDAGRSREKASTPNDASALGGGYAAMASTSLLLDHPAQELRIFNRGISGNKVHQLAERWDADCLNLRPGLVSILIGVNDYWHTLSGGYKGTVDVYEKDYRDLVVRTLDGLPGVSLVICEPFVLRCGAVNEKWFPEFDRYRAAARRVAEEFKAVFVPFQLMFDRAIKIAPPEHWAKDGVHPSAAGSALMAHAWIRAVQSGKRG
ncbi:MAG: SGNH/GDSL hydrolase family protein [Verrucomicrobia bacterium]|nr:SGNH/GDSL hydrolase family protein [Verrucomicrobiota bacterium]